MCRPTDVMSTPSMLMRPSQGSSVLTQVGDDEDRGFWAPESISWMTWMDRTTCFLVFKRPQVRPAKSRFSCHQIPRFDAPRQRDVLVRERVQNWHPQNTSTFHNTLAHGARAPAALRGTAPPTGKALARQPPRHAGNRKRSSATNKEKGRRNTPGSRHVSNGGRETAS